ncbi:EXLDI protein [Virgisporangium ochraceum]|nr:EXLDI protein [Virgisporangium ochraceum]
MVEGSVREDVAMPNKTIYVSDDDMPLLRRAQELAGGNLSAAITTAVRRYVETEEGKREGFDEIVVRVGTGTGRQVRFTGVLLGEWGRSTLHKVETYRVYRSRGGKFVVHAEDSGGYQDTGPDADKWNTGWRAWVGNWSPNQTWTVTPAERTLRVAESLDELRGLVPAEIYDLVAEAADKPDIEDLDI